ncbi:hypothetical protein EVAR_24761_1 [Eumeta japonica]|uniref:Uncharacterized protein n=1 Tax=Eumeta variegata TaxID=151549 RepID=A0A4C1VC83_EUMVA|nr:hypothetical protein EVAR_24761_1 [Eumeta japonica]
MRTRDGPAIRRGGRGAGRNFVNKPGIGPRPSALSAHLKATQYKREATRELVFELKSHIRKSTGRKVRSKHGGEPKLERKSSPYKYYSVVAAVPLFPIASRVAPLFGVRGE